MGFCGGPVSSFFLRFDEDSSGRVPDEDDFLAAAANIVAMVDFFAREGRRRWREACKS